MSMLLRIQCSFQRFLFTLMQFQSVHMFLQIRMWYDSLKGNDCLVSKRNRKQNLVLNFNLHFFPQAWL